MPGLSRTGTIAQRALSTPASSTLGIALSPFMNQLAKPVLPSSEGLATLASTVMDLYVVTSLILLETATSVLYATIQTSVLVARLARQISTTRTHPLIKFKTMVRGVNVTTIGDHDNGQPMPVMGDRRGGTLSKATETTPTPSTNAATQVQTVADLHPSEPAKVEDTKPEVTPEVVAVVEEELVAIFVRDSVPDGSVLPPNCVFEQTWTLRNGGNKPWPAGCTVRFVGGDNMCAVDPEHPASVHELVSATESTTCYSEVSPGHEFNFTVLMRTPSRPGTFISYWRLTGPTGNKFGHRLWCDVTVDAPAPIVKEGIKEEVKEEPNVEPKVEAESSETSQMIFPKLDKESPTTSIHQETVIPAKEQHDADEFEDFVEEDAELEDDQTEDGFLTDEEYDILDASDEEYLAEQGKAVKK